MIDLHVHSTISDGTYTPSGIAELAKERGLKAYVITDHDNISGCEESLEAAKRLGLETMYAMEMSVSYLGRDLHIVSIGFDPESEAFQKLYRKIRVLKESGTEETVAYIQRMGMNLSYENVKSHASGEHPDRYDVMKELVRLCPEYTAGELWRKYIYPALDELGIHYEWEAEELLPLMKEAGAVTSLAHFHKRIGLATFEKHEREDVIRTLLGFGLTGMERYYNNYSVEDSAFAAAMIEKYKMIPTGGTDFHGGNRKGVELGTGINNSVCVPYSFWTEIQKYANR